MSDGPERFDAIVVGGGPAGLAAATWLGRYRRSTLVLDSGEYRNAPVEHVHGYLGADPVPPATLRESALAGLEQYPWVQVRRARADAVEGAVDGFVTRAGGDEVHSARVVLATGVRDVLPDVEGFEEHYGASLFHCPSCDGLEARGRLVVVFGWSEHVVGFAAQLLDWAAGVTVLTDGRRFEGDDDDRERLAGHGIRVVERVAVRLVGSRGAMRGVRLDDGTTVPADLGFFSVAHRPRTDLARALGCAIDDEGYVEVDEEAATTVPGVYAAGDVTPGVQLVQVAAAEGTVAGIACAVSFGAPRGGRARTGVPVGWMRIGRTSPPRWD